MKCWNCRKRKRDSYWISDYCPVCGLCQKEINREFRTHLSYKISNQREETASRGFKEYHSRRWHEEKYKN